MNKNYNICSRCIMDTSASEIEFDNNNICNYCSDFKKINTKKNYKKLENFVNEIKRKEKNKNYDCAFALSGGLDSSWALVKCVEMGLRPLVIHFDNGWNSKLAQSNIHNLVSKLNLDLETYVINWEEYKSLMNSFLKSNVIDIEMLMDNGMVGANFKIANKYKINYIFSGFNNSSEGMKIPKNWNWFKKDKKNILSINKKFENISLSTYPIIGTIDYIYYRFIKNIKWISPLDYFDYNKENAIKELEKKFNFEKYENKHYESFFTKFYQSFILPKKFGVDKRRLHLSNLIISNQISRNQALKIIKCPAYNEKKIEHDIDYFLKKMSLTKSKFLKYMNEKPIEHDYYGTEIHIWKFFNYLFLYLRKLKLKFKL